jgi:hypothetical protein
MAQTALDLVLWLKRRWALCTRRPQLYSGSANLKVHVHRPRRIQAARSANSVLEYRANFLARPYNTQQTLTYNNVDFGKVAVQ